MRSTKSGSRWQAVCLTPEHRSFSSKPMATYAAAAAEMSREHPTCVYEMVLVTVGVKDELAGPLNQFLGHSADELVGD
ncbi:hypothetical protein B7R54_04395 [Subtercola boreus]|uniref:Uncharacterized protein n=1 Tax=Subtercola boreus TaxID=120213 RepID=A0A3E0VGQ1_9MICO|nr:hypothetical protein [Subtercola boreus]RFA08550.1 hypothetical protein B7R54_04395 [Subtercola boreus]TQL54520.1 hypothetical protein FB464_2059 [Subtercola boreus]